MALLLEEMNLSRGIVANQTPETLPFGVLNDARNVYWENGRLKKRPGYTVIKASGLPFHARFARYFVNASGTKRLIACTKAKLYNYNSATNAFDELIAASADFASTADNPYYDADQWGGVLYLVKRGGDFWKWNGSDANATSVSGAIAVGPTYLRAFNSRLIGGYCKVGATTYPQAIYWSAPDLPEDWAGAGSGNENRLSLRGDLTGIETVARGVALFSEESIEMMIEGPDSTTPFFFDPTEPTLGSGAPHSICKLGPPFSGNIVFLGSDLNLHVFNGLRATPVGDAIHPILKAVIERDSVQNAWGRVWDELGVYRLALPTAGSTENNLIVDWWYRHGAFYLHEFAGTNKAWTCSSRWVKSAALTWLALRTAGTTWAQLRAQGLSWAELRKSTGKREVAFLGSAGDFVAPFEGLNDGAAAISAYAEFSPTNCGIESAKEFDDLEILDDRIAASNELDIRLARSMDGANWQWEARTHALGPTSDPFVNWRQMGRYFKVRVANGGASQVFNLKGFRLYGQPAGEKR